MKLTTLHQLQLKLTTRSKIIAMFALVLSLMFPFLTLSRLSHSAGAQTPHPENHAQTPDAENHAWHARDQDPKSTLHHPAGPQTVYAPIIGMHEPGAAELVLNSGSPGMMNITPTFYTADGTAIEGQMLTLEPLEARHVLVADLLPQDYPGDRKMGGMSLSYYGVDMEVGTQLTLYGQGRGGSVDVPFKGAMEYKSTIQEATWWMPNRGVATIVLGNASDAPIQVLLKLSDGESQVIPLAPHATEVVRQQSKGRDQLPTISGGSAGSARLEVTGPVGSLVAAGYVTAVNDRYASAIRFYDPGAVHQPHLFATRLRVNTRPKSKAAALHMVLKNTSDAPLWATPRFRPASGEPGDPFELPAISLAPQQSAEVDLGPLTQAAATKSDLNVVSVQVVNSGASGSLIGALSSIDPATRTTYEVPLRDTGTISQSNGGHPWRLDGDYSTNISITNVSDKPAKFTVDVFYKDGGNDGKYVLNPQELAVGETAVFDMRKIRDEQLPDNTGNTIPSSIEGGHFHWSVYAGDNSTYLIGRSEVVSVTRNISSSFSCPSCCNDSYYDGLTNPISLVYVFAGFSNFTVSERRQSCSSFLTGPYDVWADWYVNDPGITSIAMTSTGRARAEGLMEGSTSFHGTWPATIYYWNWQTGGCNAFQQPGRTPNTPATVQAELRARSISVSPPSIRGVTPPGGPELGQATIRVEISSTPRTPQGTTVVVEVFQTSNPGNVDAEISDDGIKGVEITNPGSVTPATFTVRPNPQNGNSGTVQYSTRLRPNSQQVPEPAPGQPQVQVSVNASEPTPPANLIFTNP